MRGGVQADQRGRKHMACSAHIRICTQLATRVGGRRFCFALSAGTVLRYDLPSSFNVDIDPAGVDADLAELERVSTEGTRSLAAALHCTALHCTALHCIAST